MPDVEHVFTYAALIAGCSLVAAMVVMERQPRKSLEPRLLPTTPIMFAGALIAILALVHLMTLLGVRTGQGF